ncbi:DUF1349 domain-containing protein [Deinococcus rubellus]|uniref:DUF1349 domain-containing protein n=1 Tax=Deinococcus rubellus TaxID=1889240 RepID=A0ABY5YJX6_9DEIO|nr:DUF1349 domain-containing protein [Deinococcus rubellus]UWX64996.1 DUF1349 domain-containing protein [Deinococcus rubellus]
MTDWHGMTWLNEPPRWSADQRVLRLWTAQDTDFWRRTHYGFTHDSGHFLGLPAQQTFTAQVRVRGAYTALYDQAGLMLRAGAEHWIKAGVEFVGQQQLSAVVTHGFSDWSVCPVGSPAFFDLKMTRQGDALSVHSRLPDADWSLLRLAYLPPDLAASVGVYACSPQGGGFEVVFSDFALGPAETGALY